MNAPRLDLPAAVVLLGAIAASCSGGPALVPDGRTALDLGVSAGDLPSVHDSGRLGDGPASFVPPYALPASGEVVRIPLAGRNVANDVKPAPHGGGSWQYVLFQSYGGGVLQPGFSPGGAYVMAGQGGHGVPPLFGAAIFDFTDGRWSYRPNGNGLDEARTEDLSAAETTGLPYVEVIPSLLSATTLEMPAPGHTYTLMIAPPRTLVGGSKGAVIRVFGTAMAGPKVWDSYQSHQIDLASGVWTRAAKNLASTTFTASALTDQSAALDPLTNRIYVSGDWPNGERLAYLDLNDRTWKASPSFSNAPGGDRWARSIWVDAERRLLLILAHSGSTGTTSLWGFDLESIGAGPKAIKVEGGVPNLSRRWHKFPASDGGDDCYYTLRGRPATAYDSGSPPLAEGQSLEKLAPPAAQPLLNAWTYSQRPISGGITGEYVADLSAGANHMSRFFYVPSIGCFAWIPNGTGAVELIRP